MTGGLVSAHAEPADSTGLMLWRVTNAWQRAIRGALAPYGLTHVQFVLLAGLVWMDRDEPVTQRDLADQAVTDPMMTSQVVRVLQDKGLIVRGTHPTDRRARVLSPTPAGIELANRANAAVEEADRAWFAPLGRSVSSFTRQLGVLDAANRP